MHLGGFVNVFEDTHDSEHRRGVNAFAERLVIKTHVAAGDGDLQLLASLGDAVDGLRELPHDVRLLRVAEVQAIGRTDGRRARTRDFAGSLRYGVHRADTRIEVAPASIAIKSHGQTAVRAFDADHAGIAGTGSLDRVGLHHVIILLPDPPFAGDVRVGEQRLQLPGEVAALRKSNMLRLLARDWRLPAR